MKICKKIFWFVFADFATKNVILNQIQICNLFTIAISADWFADQTTREDSQKQKKLRMYFVYKILWPGIVLQCSPLLLCLVLGLGTPLFIKTCIEGQDQ